jgi:NAD(P)-dependent dehydrogenase (short-subunit alcohol dehydrogenase family)
MANTQDFNGKWALVTGASAGIGIALARELASHGAKLIRSPPNCKRKEPKSASSLRISTTLVRRSRFTTQQSAQGSRLKSSSTTPASANSASSRKARSSRN